MKLYDFQVRREGRWWMVYVPEIDGLTQARRLTEARDMARSLIAITLDVPEDSFDVSMHINTVGGVPVAELVRVLEEERRELEEAGNRFHTHQRQVARDLVDEGVPMRDVGEILGVSHQRVQQLVSS